MTQYMPRSAWTSSSRGGAQLTGTRLEGLVCHWPGTTTNAYGVEPASVVAARLRGWRAYHVSGRGWSDIGYNFAGDQAGRIWDLRGLGRVGAHSASLSNPDANHEWIAVLFILGDQEEPSAALIQAFRDFRYDVFLRRWSGRTKLTGHGDAPGVPGAQTSCPGPFVANQISNGALRQRPAAGEEEEDALVAITEEELNAKFQRIKEILAEHRDEEVESRRLIAQYVKEMHDDRKAAEKRDKEIHQMTRDAIAELRAVVEALHADRG